MTPDGLLSSVAGPIASRHNDWSIWKGSTAKQKVEAMNNGLEEWLYLFGDAAYYNRNGVLRPHTSHRGAAALTTVEKAENAILSTLRIAIEHAFGEMS